jgi:hypothetical protein
MAPGSDAAIREGERDQTRALVRTFLARFFENEITQGLDDLKAFFFWLLPFLGAPNFLYPIGQMFHWNLIARIRGPEALRLATQGEKTVYLGLAMVAAGVLSAITWNSLLPDRRDGLILGALPVRSRTVVRAKLGALALYVGIVAVTTHLLASVTWGVFLASGNTFVFAVRGILVHFVVACGASLFVLLSVTAIQGAVLAVAGPRLFSRLSPVLQFALVAVVVTGFLALPTIGGSALDTLRGSGRNLQPWILYTPPMWFLGLYESALGTSDPTLHLLAGRGALAAIAVIGTTLVVYPLAYQQMMTAAVQSGGAGAERVGSPVLTRTLVAVSGRDQIARGSAQFLISTLGRVERHRFVLAVALAISAAWALPTWMALPPSGPSGPGRALLALPIAAMTFLLVAVRVGASLPSDLRAAWLFEVHDAKRAVVRRVMERTMAAIGIAPIVAGFGAAFWYAWGPQVATAFAMYTGALGALVIEILLWRYNGMPCARPWNPDRLKARTRWYLYVAAFLFLTTFIPRLERSLLDDPFAIGSVTALLLTMAILLRIFSLRQIPLPPDDPHALAVGELLSLN